MPKRAGWRAPRLWNGSFFSLKPSGLRIRSAALGPGAHELAWEGQEGVSYQLVSSADLEAWSPEGGTIVGSGRELFEPLADPLPQRSLYKLKYGPVPPPAEEPENAGFFRNYGEFSS